MTGVLSSSNLGLLLISLGSSTSTPSLRPAYIVLIVGAVDTRRWLQGKQLHTAQGTPKTHTHTHTPTVKNRVLFIIIIIIKRGWQCKAGRERLTPYQSEDPNPTTPTQRKKEEKGKTVVGYKK